MTEIEFMCPHEEYKETKIKNFTYTNQIDISYCESWVQGKGCKNIRFCPAYENAKMLEAQMIAKEVFGNGNTK